MTTPDLKVNKSEGLRNSAYYLTDQDGREIATVNPWGDAVETAHGMAAWKSLLEALRETGFADLPCELPTECNKPWGQCAPCKARAAIAKATQL